MQLRLQSRIQSQTTRARRLAPFFATLIVLIAACDTETPTGPTPIPSPSRTVTLTPSPSPQVSDVPDTPLPPVVTSTPNQSNDVNVFAPTATFTPSPFCVTARDGDTWTSLLIEAGWTYEKLEEAKRFNNKVDNNIVPGDQYCFPPPTGTPTPEGYDITRTAQAASLPQLQTPGSFTILEYRIREGDDLFSLQYNTGTVLRQLCELNNPQPLNCSGCDLSQPFYPKCRPLLRAGDIIRYPGPPPTATITPTLTGEETATPTPEYRAPMIIAPALNSEVSGIPELSWIVPGVLQANEQYYVLWQNATTGATGQLYTTANSVRLPDSMRPTDGQPHVINWQVIVVRLMPDNVYVTISPQSVIASFTWLP
jgi:hypothetical protein